MIDDRFDEIINRDLMVLIGKRNCLHKAYVHFSPAIVPKRSDFEGRERTSNEGLRPCFSATAMSLKIISSIRTSALSLAPWLFTRSRKTQRCLCIQMRFTNVRYFRRFETRFRDTRQREAGSGDWGWGWKRRHGGGGEE